jgi:hypothetical protein
MPHASSVAFCLSGAMDHATSSLPCTVTALVEQMILPLRGEVYAFLSVSSATLITDAEVLMRRLLNRTALRALRIDVQSRKPGPETADCEDGQGANNGYPQSIGFGECAAHASQHGYDWMVRVRPDGSYPFLLPELPRTLRFPTPRGLVIAHGVGSCDCAYSQKPKAYLLTLKSGERRTILTVSHARPK